MVGIIYERRHTRLISEYGGIWKVMPFFALLLLVVAFSSMGVPGTNGFVGELLILIGTFKLNVWYGAVATIGLILGEITNDKNRHLSDMNFREYAYMIPILVFIIWIGIYPKPFLDKMQVSVEHLIEQIKYTKDIDEGEKREAKKEVKELKSKRVKELNSSTPELLNS